MPALMAPAFNFLCNCFLLDAVVGLIGVHDLLQLLHLKQSLLIDPFKGALDADTAMFPAKALSNVEFSKAMDKIIHFII